MQESRLVTDQLCGAHTRGQSSWTRSTPPAAASPLLLSS